MSISGGLDREDVVHIYKGPNVFNTWGPLGARSFALALESHPLEASGSRGLCEDSGRGAPQPIGQEAPWLESPIYPA